MVNKKRLVAITLAILMLVMECLSLFSCGKKVENFELSFNVDGENYATITTTGTETIQIPENPSKDGYTFDGWYWDKDVWSKPFTANSLLDAPISSDMSVYAKFTPIAYSISYEMDGGTHNNSATYTIESSFEFANAKKTGYTFLGWYTDATYTTQIKSISAGTTGDMTLYAKFESTSYSITYENTEGADNTNPTTYTISSDIITFAPLFKDGYTFDGWYDSNGNKITEIVKGSMGNLTLIAQFTINEYTISFDSKGGNAISPIKQAYNTNVFAPSDPIRVGYEFEGWYIKDTTELYEFGLMPACDVELYAKWSDASTFDITYELAGGQNHVSNPLFYTVEDEILLGDATKVGYAFDGWYLESTYTTRIESISKGNVGDKTLYAKWSDASIFDITYELAGGENCVSNPLFYTVEDEILLGDATKVGYTFDGWYLESTYVTRVESISKGNAGDKTLFAKFIINQYTISFEVNDGSAIAPIVQDYNTAVTAPPKPIKENWSFAGWYADSSFNTEYVFGNMPAENTTVYVKWIPYDVYDIEYNHSIFGVSAFETITADTFDAICVDTDGNNVTINVQIVGTQESGRTISVILTAKSKDITSKVTITNIKVYGNPELTFNNTLTYFNYDEGVNEEWANATGLDTYGEATEIKVYVENEYKAGDVVTVIIEAIDPAGNVTYGCLENVKVYGDPVIIVQNSVEQINNTDTITMDLFGPSTTDSFGMPLDVSISWIPNAKDISSFVNGEAVSYYTSASSSKTVEFTALNTERYTLYYQGAYTYISVYCVDTESYVYSSTYTSSTSMKNISFNVKAGYTYQVETYAYSADRCTDFTMYLVSSSSKIDSTVFSIENMAGKSIIVTFTATDAYGNVGTLTIPIRVYGTPTINIEGKTDFQLSDEVTVDSLGLTAIDSFGEKISNITLSLKCGERVAGQTMIYTATTIDVVGNVANRDIYVKIYGTPSLTINRNGIKENEVVTLDSFDIIAQDSFGNNVIVNYELISGEQKKGTKMEYKFEAIDVAGNICTTIVPIGVYSVDDILMNIANPSVTAVKIASDGSEFGVTAKDSLGENCRFYIEAVNGILVAGQTMDIRLVAIDKAGNKVTSDIFENVKIYDTPKITLMQNSYVITADANIEFLFTAHDSFGDELVFEVTADKPLISGEYVDILVVVTDSVGNSARRTYTFAVAESSKPSVNLHYNGELIDHAFLDDGANYKLALPPVEKFDVFYGWADVNGNYYTDEYGNGIIEITDEIELYAKTKLGNFSYIWNVTQLKSMELNKNYVLACDVDLAGETWSPLGTSNTPFTGILYGNGYSISNFKLSGGYTYLGFIGYNAGEISNIKFSGVTISSNQNNSYLGMVAAYNTGIIQYCSATGRINLTRYNPYVGGAVGANAKDAMISNVTVDMVLTTSIPTSPSSSTMFGGTVRIGGIAGSNNGTICDSIVTSNITTDLSSTTPSNRFKSFDFSAYVGGVAGYSTALENNIVSNCTIVVDGKGSSAYCYVGGAVGYKTGGSLSDLNTSGNISGSASTSGSYGSIYKAGGIIGYNTTGTVNSSFSFCNLNVDGSTGSSGYPATCMTGGLVGHNGSGIISNSYSTGTIRGITTFAASTVYSGGLVGQNDGTVFNCYSSGDVIAEAGGSSVYSFKLYAGGAVGHNTGTINNCVVWGDCKVVTISQYSNTRGTYVASAVCAYNQNGTLSNVYYIDTQTRTIEYKDTTKTSDSSNSGVAASAEILNTNSFYIDILDWDIEIWDFSNNEIPFLK